MRSHFNSKVTTSIKFVTVTLCVLWYTEGLRRSVRVYAEVQTMDYDLPSNRVNDNILNTRNNDEFGALPDAMIMSRFEETDMGPDEEVYNDYARVSLTDTGPDRNLFEHEGPRGAVNARSGKLQLQYYGHRGNSEFPHHPEMFLGFGGAGDVDPRGYAVEPDFKKLTEQENARMRFIRFTPDDSDFVTGGGVSEYQTMQMQQTLLRRTRDNMRVFSPQRDGRREGLRRTYAHRPELEKQVTVQAYGDVIQDFAMNPQKHVVLVSDRIIRDTNWYRCGNQDQDFEIAKFYDHNARRQVRRTTANPTEMSAPDADFQQSDKSKCYKALGILMGQLIRNRQTIQYSPQDIDYGAEGNTQVRKSEAVSRDIAIILRSLDTDTDLASSANTWQMKTPRRTLTEHLANTTEQTHSLPAHLLHNAELMYKSVQPDADVGKIREQMVTDNDPAIIMDTLTKQGKTTRANCKFGGILKGESQYDIEDFTTVAHNYKTARNHNRVDGGKRVNVADGENFKKESDMTRVGRRNHQNYMITGPDNLEHMMGFARGQMNMVKGGKLGNKSNVRKGMDRDNALNDISALA